MAQWNTMSKTSAAAQTSLADVAAALRNGTLPAGVGALGAVLSTYALPVLFAPASLPMSVLGLVLGRHSRDPFAMALGALGVVLALSSLLKGDALWLLLALVA